MNTEELKAALNAMTKWNDFQLNVIMWALLVDGVLLLVILALLVFR